MASLKNFAKRTATLRESMEAKLEEWQEKHEGMEYGSKAYEDMETTIGKLEDAISTLEGLESELEEE